MASVPTTQPPGSGWLPWLSSYADGNPYDYAEVEIWRYGDMDTSLLVPTRLRPTANVAGLYWRPAGPMLTRAEQLRVFFRPLR